MRNQGRNVEHNPDASHQDGGCSWSQTWPTKRMWARIAVCLIERVEDPAVLSQHRGIGQGDVTGMSPSSPSVAVRRASRKMMHEGAVRDMAEGASGRALKVTRGTACGGVVMAPAGKTPKTKGRRRQVEGVHGFSLTERKLSEETSTRTTCRSDTMAESL